MHTRHEIIIPLDLYKTSTSHRNWILHISRENNSSHVMFEIIFGDNAHASHGGAVTVEALGSEITKLLQPQTVE